MARLAHQMAVESPYVSADVVEITEFPHLAQKYKVMAVPKVIINGKVEVEGALPEDRFMAHIMQALES